MKLYKVKFLYIYIQYGTSILLTTQANTTSILLTTQANTRYITNRIKKIKHNKKILRS
jgi:hypothetical protein